MLVPKLTKTQHELLERVVKHGREIFLKGVTSHNLMRMGLISRVRPGVWNGYYYVASPAGVALVERGDA